MTKELLLNIARKAIEANFTEVDLDEENLLKEYKELNDVKASFVTINLDGKLRGCIGSLIAHRTLLSDLIHNAKAAAFADPRFSPLSKEEFDKISIEISLLTKPEVLEYSDFEDLKQKLIPYKHGVILELDGKRATFLPQVWEQLPSFNDFMVHLCQKAGLQADNLSGFPKIQIYEAIKIK